jgi:hypothetical protein
MLGIADKMAYWYPTQERTAKLEAELSSLERLSGELARNLAEFFSMISDALGRALSTEGFPQHQLGQWIWVASQFRGLARADSNEAIVAGAALIFLGKRVDAGRIDAAAAQDLNWVLDLTIRRLRSNLNPQGFRFCLTPDELIAIESRLERFASTPKFDPDAIRQRVASRVSVLETMSVDRHIRGVVAKVDALFEASARDDKGSAAAREALLYLAEEADAIPDSYGLLGLFDDMYVIDENYAVVEGLTRRLPLLLALLDRWPFVADLALAGVPHMPLDRFGQYFACACLNSLFAGRRPDLLIITDSAGYGAIAAFFAAVQCAKMQGNSLAAEIGSWPEGQPVTISDGQKKFALIFKGVETLGDKRKFRMGVRDSGTVTVDMNIAPFISRSAMPHTRLSDGAQLLRWLKYRHVDPLATLTGFERRRLYQQECVLLLGPRHKVDDYFSCLRPFETSASALLGAKYVDAHLDHHDLDHQTSDAPFIYTCSDPATAWDLIRERPEHVSGWRVIVDGAMTGRTLRDLLQSSRDHADVPVCIIGELHEREATQDLLHKGMAVWYLEDQDVEAPPSTMPRVSDKDDPLTRSLRRRGGHWAQTIEVRSVRSDFLERAAACLDKFGSSKDDGTSIQALEYSVAAFIQKATSHPFASADIARQLGDEVRKITALASTLRIFDPRAREIDMLFREWTPLSPPTIGRQGELVDLIESIPPSRSLAVVCRSEQVAERCRAFNEARPKLRRAIWTNLQGLRKSAPYDWLIVAGWLDKMSMREIAANGYGARLELILYPFEQRWFDSIQEASRKWERRLEGITAISLRDASLLQGPVEEPVRADPHDSEESHSPVFEEIEARAIAALQRRMDHESAHHETASARLVLFEEDGRYAFLRPEGVVIVLADPDDGQPDRRLSPRTNAQQMLFRRVSTLRPGMIVAFPSGNDRDLVDARADQFIKNAPAVRWTADIWKEALKRHLKPTKESYEDFSRRLKLEGEPRDPYTVRAWTIQTGTIAPRNYRLLVPLIAKLTGDADLKRRTEEVLTAIDQIYRARSEAAEAIAREIFSGKIDVNAEHLSFELDGVVIHYSLHRVRELAGVMDVQIDLIGKIGSLGDELDRPQ